jgi:hypothetical protein
LFVHNFCMQFVIFFLSLYKGQAWEKMLSFDILLYLSQWLLSMLWLLSMSIPILPSPHVSLLCFLFCCHSDFHIFLESNLWLLPALLCLLEPVSIIGGN